MNKNIIHLLVIALLLTGCDDLFSPALENNPSREHMYEDPLFAQGILLNGYSRIPTASWSFNDVATDDAVSNDQGNDYRKAATGQWSSRENPFERWRNCYSAIQYVNIMLEEIDKVSWADNELINQMFADRLKGEAYGLRGLFMYYLLQAHGGWTASGELLGVPILTEVQEADADFNLPRASFEDCMKQLYSDLDEAEKLLPLDFEDISDVSEIPAKYPGATLETYNRVFGYYSRLRVTARIVKGIRAKAALLAASPAYTEGTTTTWAEVANYTGEVLDLIGGIGGMDDNGAEWYANDDEIKAILGGINPPEMLWRGNITKNTTSLEEDHFPPTLFGKGRLNPTQNLVDAFPMANGYPISASASLSGYDAQDPYFNRDPRLEKYIVVNGSRLAGATINIGDGSGNDAVNQTETSTRTGYYMRKLLRGDVNINPISINGQHHYIPHIRYTEMFLTYAEAANEAWGPTGKGGHTYSAYEVIKRIRERAGVGLDNGDAYLESIKNDQQKMRELIRNERRLELCFEGHRFWDLRRWNETLTETARGIRLTTGTYKVSDVENRVYQDYMYHGPIPYEEMMKWDALVQNKGW